MTLASGLYEKKEDRTAAMELFSVLVAAGRRFVLPKPNEPPTGSMAGASSQNASNASQDKIAHKIAMQVKKKDEKVSGNSEASWKEFIDEYLLSFKFDCLRHAGCMNCGAPDHMMNKDPKPVNVSRAASRHIH